MLICGDHNWQDADLIRQEIKKLGVNNIECVIEGECQGADVLARDVAKSLFLPVLPFPADWDNLGKPAGPIRNKQMLDEGQPTMVLAFHDNIRKSKGTRNMLAQARRRKIVCKVVSH